MRGYYTGSYLSQGGSYKGCTVKTDTGMETIVNALESAGTNQNFLTEIKSDRSKLNNLLAVKSITTSDILTWDVLLVFFVIVLIIITKIIIDKKKVN